MQALWLEGESQAASKPQLSKPAVLWPRHALKFLGTSKPHFCFQASTLRPLCYMKYSQFKKLKKNGVCAWKNWSYNRANGGHTWTGQGGAWGTGSAHATRWSHFTPEWKKCVLIQDTQVCPESRRHHQRQVSDSSSVHSPREALSNDAMSSGMVPSTPSGKKITMVKMWHTWFHIAET